MSKCAGSVAPTRAVRSGTWQAAALCIAGALAGCGGGGGGNATGAVPTPPASNWIAGSFLPAATFAGRCVNPRAGTNPAGGIDVQGTTLEENNWLRSWSHDLYLWYDEIVDRDPGSSTTAAYFNLLKTNATTPSGAPKDRFHFTYATTEWLALIQSGTEAGYGAAWSIVSSVPPRRIVVAYTHPGSPATAGSVNLTRGEEVVAVDGIDVVGTNTQAGIDAIVAGLYPEQVGETHTFTLRNPTSGTQRTVTMQSAVVTLDPVQNVGTIDTPTGKVGYLQFNDHIPTAEQELISAFTSFASQNVADLVLDLRYNGGGLLAMASEVAYMIAGPAATAGRTFEQLRFNDKHTSINPVTGAPLTPMPFYDTSSTGERLPTLNLPRVYVLTGSTTCSASESIINGLLGVGVQVIQVGATTCGKPYGFYPTDNCGTTYFTIQMMGVNAAGFGDYGDGFTPNNSVGTIGERLPGCSVRDDFDDPLGDAAEDRLAAALELRDGQACPVPSAVKPSLAKPLGAAAGDLDGEVVKSPWLMNRWVEAR